MLYTCRNDKILRFLLLHDQPHTLNIVPGIAPVTQGIHVSQFQMILQTFCNASCSQCDLTCNEIFTTTLRLMIEQNAVNSEHSISITVFLHHPEAILLCHSVRGIWMKRCGFFLWNLFYLAIQFRSRCLIYFTGLCQTADTDSFQHTQDTQCIHITGIFRRIKGYLHMALGSQIINFIRSDLSHQTDQP